MSAWRRGGPGIPLAAAGLRYPRVDEALVAPYLERFIREGLLLPGAPGSG